jgi:hypothetical protein
VTFETLYEECNNITNKAMTAQALINKKLITESEHELQSAKANIERLLDAIKQYKEEQ